ncbi:hypothetical protein G6F50_014282 [Rhizopus delemar]|uniref:Uncharacterized protein n=1 Tax=Rhizopus delemar TaxID=936053 RepID=A0A9P7C899_9FUNG|nr:hypothetical protein G6F50_014282 [Rhizopus delemar]
MLQANAWVVLEAEGDLANAGTYVRVQGWGHHEPVQLRARRGRWHCGRSAPGTARAVAGALAGFPRGPAGLLGIRRPATRAARPRGAARRWPGGDPAAGKRGLSREREDHREGGGPRAGGDRSGRGYRRSIRSGLRRHRCVHRQGARRQYRPAGDRDHLRPVRAAGTERIQAPGRGRGGCVRAEAEAVCGPCQGSPGYRRRGGGGGCRQPAP